MEMKKSCVWFCFVLLAMTMAVKKVQAQVLWDAGHLATVKEKLKQPMYRDCYRQLLKDADKRLGSPCVSVLMKEKVAVSGDRHDYLSQARYFWPDSTKADGRPYVNRDGQSNPEIYRLDRPKLQEMADAVKTLSLAYFFSGDERYARKAVEQLRVWFLNRSTRMNPHLKYAQVVPGRDGDNGRSFGVLDAYSFVEMLDAVRLLEGSKAYTAKDDRGLKQWFATLLEWIVNDPMGQEENRARNNHGTAYDVQVIAYALFTGQEETARRFISNFTGKRIEVQIRSNGSQPLELKRTLGFGYSVYNLTHTIDVLLMARHAGMEVGGDSQYALRMTEKAADFLMPYLGKPVEQWPYQQISKWQEEQQNLSLCLYRLWLLNPKRKDYLSAYQHYARKDEGEFTLLYVNPDLTCNAYAAAEKQLSFALKCMEEAKTVETEQNGLFSPRCVNNDSTLRLVRARDWTSGFFPGSLWQLYQYTGKEKWRKAADELTWRIEPMKDCRETHDLGFVVYNSFGRAYRATGDTRYRDVVVQAARSLASRYSSKVRAIRSWDHHREQWKFPVIIDNMMNLELLFEATELTGDYSFRNIAINHANTTLENHFREDGSSYHVVSYNPKNGKVEKKNTHQGAADESVWSRGQAWGLYGFTMCYRYTHDSAYLDQARKIAAFFFSQENLPEDLIPYWDMKAPDLTTAPRDASAAAVFASGLYELATYVDKKEAKEYRKIAERIMKSLYHGYRSKTKENCGFLLLHSTGNYPAGDEIDKPISYADYYYLEAMGRR